MAQKFGSNSEIPDPGQSPWGLPAPPNSGQPQDPSGGWGPPASVPPKGLSRGDRIRRGLVALTSAQQRQTAFRGPHGFSQGLRYALGAEPVERRTLGMYRTEAFQNVANPRQFEGVINQPEEVEEP